MRYGVGLSIGPNHQFNRLLYHTPGLAGKAIPMPKTTRSTHMTPAQRRAEVVELLTRGLLRLHDRGVLHKQPPGQNALDLARQMPLSVGKGDHTG